MRLFHYIITVNSDYMLCTCIYMCMHVYSWRLINTFYLQVVDVFCVYSCTCHKIFIDPDDKNGLVISTAFIYSHILLIFNRDNPGNCGWWKVFNFRLACLLINRSCSMRTCHSSQGNQCWHPIFPALLLIDPSWCLVESARKPWIYIHHHYVRNTVYLYTWGVSNCLSNVMAREQINWLFFLLVSICGRKQALVAVV